MHAVLDRPIGMIGNLWGRLPTRFETLPRPGDLVSRIHRWYWLTVAVIVGLGYLALVVGAALPGAANAAAGHATTGSSSTHRAVAFATVWVVLGAGTLLALIAALGWRTVSSPVGSVRGLIRSSASVFCLAELPMLAAAPLLAVLVRQVPGAAGHTGGSDATSYAAALVNSCAAGFSEEVVALALPVLLVAALRRRPLGRVGVTVLVSVLVVIRLSYHAEYGLAVLPLVPWALVSALVYYRTRALVPLMVAHAGFDVLVATADRVRPLGGWPAVWLLLLLACVGAVLLSNITAGRRAGVLTEA